MRRILLVLFLVCTCIGTLVEAAPPEKLVALTFDDGPKPHVLYGFDTKTRIPNVPGLLDVLDMTGARATFFVMGFKAEANFRALLDVSQRGHEIENHTYGHGPFLKMEIKYGRQWVLNDIERCSKIIESITHKWPKYIRPPEWSITKVVKDEIESLADASGAKKYTIVTKSAGDIKMPPILEDLDTEDWAHYEKDLSRRPRCTLYDCVLKKIEVREKRGLYGHILVFHELPLTAKTLETLIPELQKRGYKFVTLDEYMAKEKRGGLR